jgi:hypothetical protein
MQFLSLYFEVHDIFKIMTTVMQINSTSCKVLNISSECCFKMVTSLIRTSTVHTCYLHSIGFHRTSDGSSLLKGGIEHVSFSSQCQSFHTADMLVTGVQCHQ